MKKMKWLPIVFVFCLIVSLLPIKAMAGETDVTGTSGDVVVQENSVIPNVRIESVNFSYKVGETPKATAVKTDVNANNYTVVEQWEEMQSNGNGESVPVAYWYSSSEEMSRVPANQVINTFEAGKSYMYSIYLKANDGYIFPTSSSEITVVINDNVINQALIVASSDGKSLSALAVKTMKPEVEKQTIESVAINNATIRYNPSDKPKATAILSDDVADKCEIVYESWEKLEKKENDEIVPVAYWYSDESQYTDEKPKFTEFEKGVLYQYDVYLKAKDGYEFASKVTVTLNGDELAWGAFVTTINDAQNCAIDSATELRPGSSVEAIYIENATVRFEAGDKPVFTAKPGDYQPYYIDHERWDCDDAGITSSDYWNSRYGEFDGSWGHLIESFDADKEYTYGIYLKLTNEGYKEGYHFDENTKLYIDYEQIDLSNAQIEIEDDGIGIWINNVLKMTPEIPIEWQRIDVIEINGATVNFNVGDKPVFTGTVPENAHYKYQCERWETDGAGITSEDFWNTTEMWGNLISEFEAGKTYTYGVYLKTELGYYFDRNTKVKVNGQEVSYNVDYYDIDDPDFMVTYWIKTNLTMTPGSTTNDIVNNKSCLLQGEDGNWYYYVNGNIDKSYGGLAQNDYGWWKITNGTVDFAYNGIADNQYGWWKVTNGTIDFNMNGLQFDIGTNTWWYFNGGAIDFNYTGLAENEYGWWKIINGAVDFAYNGLGLNEYGWWKVTNGAVDLSYNGIADNEYGWWKVTNGTVDFNSNGLLFDLGTDTWWYFNGGAIDFSYVGLAENEYGWWKITDGKVDFTYNGLGLNEYGWWYLTNGTVNFGYNGVADNQYGWWKITNGTVDYTANGLIFDSEKNAWFYFDNGAINFLYDGLALNEYGWWKISNGTVDFGFNGQADNQYGTWNVINGHVEV